MISFKEYYNLLFEGYVNLIGDGSIDQRQKYADQVWNILQQAYERMGGIKGSGFNSKEDMIQNIPFWKLFVRNGEVLVVMMYKDKNGRKGVALGTNNTPESKMILKKILNNSFSTGWGEYSKSLLAFIVRGVPFDILEPYLINVQQVQQLLPKDDIIPIDDYLKAGNKLEDKDDIKIYNNFPELMPYFYLREIGGHIALKVALGTPNKAIKN
jgi:hypothetical protein